MSGGSFRDVTTWNPTAEGAQGLITPDWAQGRAAFGGLVAAAATRALAKHFPTDRPLRSALVSFVAPVAPGAASVQMQTLRQGSSLSHGQAHLIQDERVAAVVVAAFGAARPTRLPSPGPAAPRVPPPEDLVDMPHLPGVTPAFTQHFAYRWTTRTLPFSGAQEGHVQGWIRARGDAPVDAVDLLGLLDAWPPPIWSRAKAPFPGSTITWIANICAPPKDAAGDAWWLYDARTVVAADGYSDFTACLWDRAGQLVATGRQCFAEFSGRGTFS